ncbi:hypothetical protein [Faecalibacter rhinopitheci]|uniref:Lipoprotein n=1 Tax=Faecalibacter rhinopitheci TaxID=2779678 RepID=A0A8J7FNK4_9FLAO|nr:hypothetical protein [Faecalibacter rhinopitheci]MBF0597772.1 hypothetical protein [Faecalibacter rhinopitheci]MBQ0146957.1 hypothetical protein [Candidatus Onthonaster equi]
MKKIIKMINLCLCIILSICLINSCKNDTTYDGDYNPEVIKGYKNDASTLNTKMDSIEAVNYISKKKLKEFYELSALASSNNDSVLQEHLVAQLRSFFSINQLDEVDTLLVQLKRKNVHFASIAKFNIIPNDSLTPDTIKRADYTLNLFNKNKKLVETVNRTSVFVLKQEPIKFKREFKFYFKTLNYINDSIQNDTISSGVIR